MNFPLPILLVVAAIGLFQLGVCFWMMMLLRNIHKWNNAPFWQSFQTIMAKALHHPHPESQELDHLLERLESLDIDDNGTERLELLLREKIADEKQSIEERNQAELLLIVMPMVVKERRKILQAK